VEVVEEGATRGAFEDQGQRGGINFVANDAHQQEDVRVTKRPAHQWSTLAECYFFFHQPQ
jgi:hypothetical protein